MTVSGALRVVALGSALLLAPPAAASCFDGVRDGPESDVDCGGDCPPCARDAACAAPRDCYSGRCARGVCEERLREPGEAVPAGYHTETSEADGAATARIIGFVALGAGYGAAYATALAVPGESSWMYLPVAGPWIEVSDPDQRLKGLIAVDGFLQTVGAGLVLGGVLWSGRQLVRDDALLARVLVFPAPIGRDGGGLFASGVLF